MYKRPDDLSNVAQFNLWPSSNLEILQQSDFFYIELMLLPLMFQRRTFPQTVALIKGPMNMSCWATASLPFMRVFIVEFPVSFGIISNPLLWLVVYFNLCFKPSILHNYKK